MAKPSKENSLGEFKITPQNPPLNSPEELADRTAFWNVVNWAVAQIRNPAINLPNEPFEHKISRYLLEAQGFLAPPAGVTPPPRPNMYA